MPTYSILSGSYDGKVRTYDLRMGRAVVDQFAQAVTSIRCSGDGNVVLVSSLDSKIRMLDREDGKLLKSFGGDGAPGYKNTELRIRSVFAKADSVVLSGSEGPKVFAWDVLSGEVVACLDVGGVKAVSCVAWNEKEKCWAGGCSDGGFLSVFCLGWVGC